jgi:N-acetylneuraminate synthase
VHCPELFAGDHILDLCSPDPDYRARSIRELARTIEITRQLKRHFPKTERPLIILNAGGHSKTHHYSTEEKAGLYAMVARSLTEIDTAGVELIIQTMPPFPWHFGGQSFHNLFVRADEIITFFERYGWRVCLDVSHSKLACNYLKIDFETFVRTIAPACAYLHVADASGTDGEGLQIGTGDFPIDQLCATLGNYLPTVPFIPEIWQGHKNGGEGFWVALDALDGRL